MKIDLSVAVDRKMVERMKEVVPREKILPEIDLFGHLDTLFDLMDKVFDLANLERRGLVFDVRGAGDEAGPDDVDLSRLREGDFAMFCTGTLKNKGYGTKEYFLAHPQLSWSLIESLIQAKVCMIGVDTAAIRMIDEHPKADQYCADNGVFVVEHLDNLEEVLPHAGSGAFRVNTYPMNFTGATGLPCRILAAVNEGGVL
jgi:kynurenine formamidase